MTRDEAIEIIGGEQGWPSIAGGACAAWVDIFAALGMLKLEEPKSIEDRLSEAYAGYVCLTPSGLLKQLDLAGLKLVEK